MNATLTLTVTIVLTAAVTFILTTIYEDLKLRIKKKKEEKKIREVERNLEKLQEAVYPMRILQFGRLDSNSISVRLLGEKGPNDYVNKIVSKHSENWASQIGAYNNYIYGVSEVNYPRKGEFEEMEIQLKGYLVKYYEFLATNANIKMRSDLNPDEQAWIKSKTENSDPSEPIKEFANPLSVEVILLCNDGTRAVLPTRSSKTVFRGDKLGASVMETVSPILETKDNIEREIDVFEVIKRGLKEELGINPSDLREIYVTSLAFDSEVFDYKFTVVADSKLVEGEVNARFELGLASDRWENRKLNFVKFPLDKNELSDIKKNASPEAMVSIIMAEAERFGWKKVEKSFLQ